MGMGRGIANWIGGSIAGYGVGHGGPLRGAFEGAARKFERDSSTPGFVRDRLRDERCGREAGRIVKSMVREFRR